MTDLRSAAEAAAAYLSRLTGMGADVAHSHAAALRKALAEQARAAPGVPCGVRPPEPFSGCCGLAPGHAGPHMVAAIVFDRATPPPAPDETDGDPVVEWARGRHCHEQPFKQYMDGPEKCPTCGAREVEFNRVGAVESLECNGCGFTFAAMHTYDDGTLGCPECRGEGVIAAAPPPPAAGCQAYETLCSCECHKSVRP